MTAKYLESVLRAALTAPGAASNPSVSRFVGHLLVMAAAEGGTEAIEPFLTAIPGRPARFEVRQYRRGDLTATVTGSNLNAADAVRMAILPVPPDAAGIEVVSCDDSGLKRCVLGKAGKGRLEFVFPVLDAFDGREGDKRLAHKQWLETLDTWTQSGKGRPASGAGAPGPARGSAPTGDPGKYGDVVGAVQAALSQMTVEVDLHEVEDIIRRSVTEGSSGASAGEIARHLSHVLPKPNELAEAVAQRVAAALPRSLTEAPPPAQPEEIAEMVTERITALLPKLDPGTPLADHIARVVSDRMADLLPGPGRLAKPMAAEAGSSGYDRRLGGAILKALESLTSELRDVREQVRRSRAQLDTVTSQAGASSGSGGLVSIQPSVERLRKSLSSDVERLGQQLEHRIKAAGGGGGSSGHPSQYDEEFAMLSERLMRTSAQLERMLARLEDVLYPSMDGAGAGGGYREGYPQRDGHGQRNGSEPRGRNGRPITRIGP